MCGAQRPPAGVPRLYSPQRQGLELMVPEQNRGGRKRALSFLEEVFYRRPELDSDPRSARKRQKWVLDHLM